MRLRVTLPVSVDEAFRERVLRGADKVEEEQSTEQEWQVVILVDPSMFKTLNDLLRKDLHGKSRIETLTFASNT